MDQVAERAPSLRRWTLLRGAAAGGWWALIGGALAGHNVSILLLVGFAFVWRIASWRTVAIEAEVAHAAARSRTCPACSIDCIFCRAAADGHSGKQLKITIIPKPPA